MSSQLARKAGCCSAKRTERVPRSERLHSQVSGLHRSAQPAGAEVAYGSRRDADWRATWSWHRILVKPTCRPSCDVCPDKLCTCFLSHRWDLLQSCCI